MSTVTRIAREALDRGPSDRRVVGPAPIQAPVRGRSAAARALNAWGARITWALGRTGRPGLLGLVLLLAAGVFFVSTHLRVAAEVARLRTEVAEAEQRSRSPVPVARPEASNAPRALPGRGEMPALLRQIFAHATQAKLALDSGKYEVNTTSGANVLRHHVLLPVNGPYERVREFVEATLTAMPAVGLRDLALERKAIGDGSVDARIRLTVYTTSTSPERPHPAPGEEKAGDEKKVAEAAASGTPTGEDASRKDGAALFAMHSWHVIPVVPVPPPPPPPAPTAPPFPYAFLGAYAPDGAPVVYFLSKQDRVIDAHVGDRLDGVYLFESAENGQLVFVYLPLDVRQTLAAGAAR